MRKNLTLFIGLFISFNVFSQSPTHTIVTAGGTRQYLLHLPAGYNTAQHLPLVFNFHGYGLTASLEEFYCKMDIVSDSGNFVLVYPQGISNAWNVGWTGAYNTGIDDVGFVSNMIDTLAALYNIDLNRVYACGLSNGGFMSHRLACELGNRIAAIASVAGEFSDSMAYYCNPYRKTPIMIIHGTNDPTVPYNGAAGLAIGTEQSIALWLNKNQCSAVNDTLNVPDTNTTDTANAQLISYRMCADSSEVLFYKIIGGGHTWPNALINTNYGPTCRDFDGSTEIWKFFNRYTLSGPVGINEPTATQPQIKVYPNPFYDQLKIEAPIEITSARLFNTLGQVVFETENISGSHTLNLSAVKPGMYFLKLNSKYGVSTLKIEKAGH